eukprot:4383205-Heterocapsa_arctica.AAC.1
MAVQGVSFLNPDAPAGPARPGVRRARRTSVRVDLNGMVVYFRRRLVYVQRSSHFHGLWEASQPQ